MSGSCTLPRRGIGEAVPRRSFFLTYSNFVRIYIVRTWSKPNKMRYMKTVTCDEWQVTSRKRLQGLGSGVPGVSGGGCRAGFSSACDCGARSVKLRQALSNPRIKKSASRMGHWGQSSKVQHPIPQWRDRPPEKFQAANINYRRAMSGCARADQRSIPAVPVYSGDFRWFPVVSGGFRHF